MKSEKCIFAGASQLSCDREKGRGEYSKSSREKREINAGKLGKREREKEIEKKKKEKPSPYFDVWYGAAAPKDVL